MLVETGMGNNIAAIETSRAIDGFEPEVAIFVGVAGGLKDVEIGDVVAADYVYGHESAKLTDKFQSRIKSFGCGFPLVHVARMVRRKECWHHRVTSGQTPTSYVGPLASGEQILAGVRTQTHDLIEQFCGDSLAVETEGWGFLFAAHASGDLPAIVVRGISDLTAGKSAEMDLANQPAAADHAAAFAFELIAEVSSVFGGVFGFEGQG
ncbi:hypothetical protein Acsp05_60710 [Actinokineospora sp. NBRC 105648]|nr:hypothetical protein Acsp05_60710 [Actinokineospora sp. NBRC 105648]